MQIVRYRQGRRTGYGIVQQGVVYLASGSPFRGLKRARRVGRLQDVRLLPPVRPGKILAVGRNYLDHAHEMGTDAPPEPLLFLKASSALNGPGGAIVLPKDAGRIEYEGELVAVIGKRCHNVPESKALDVVLGYTCGFDITARELQRKDGQWARAKSFDTFAPIGPVIDTERRPEGRRIQTRRNGRVVQDASTSQMIFSVPRLIAFMSRVMTLEPGDIIFTGTPSGVGPIAPGDTIEVEIEGIGVLRNLAVAEG